MKRTKSRITRNAGTWRRRASRKCIRTAVPSAPPAPRPPLCVLKPEEVRTWIRTTRGALEHKQARERVYLDRRAHHGTQTPTDDAYKQDQHLEDDLLALLDELEARL